LQNMTRSKTKFSVVEAIINDISAGASAAEIDMFYGPPMGLMGDCTRSFLTAAPGNELLVADFSAIEARVLAWLAGEKEVLDVFRSGRDIYKVAASQIFGCESEAVDDSQRQVGKVAVLALGYGGGVGAFTTMAKAYNVRMEPAFNHLWNAANPEQRMRAESTLKSAQEKKRKAGEELEISREEFLAADITKIFWREANPNIVNYWTQLELAAMNAVLHPGQFFGNGKIRFKKAGSFLWCQLPGSGVICYPYPEVKEVKTPWGTPKQGFTYMAEDGQSRKWMRFTTYGGSLAENITQAVARDLLADAMLRLDAAGFSIVGHIHDEIICEAPIGVAALSNMIAIMTANPKWALDLPLKASGFVSRRYRK
jgi:DNA polymerase